MAFLGFVMFSSYLLNKLVTSVPLYLCLAHDVTAGLVPEWRDVFCEKHMKLFDQYVIHTLKVKYLKEIPI